MKLSKAQQEILEQAKKDIDEARNSTFIQWYRNNVATANYITEMTDSELEEHLNKPENRDKMIHFVAMYMDRKCGVVLARANTRSLRKLQEHGLIKIIRDSTGTSYGIDKVLVLNY